MKYLYTQETYSADYEKLRKIRLFTIIFSAFLAVCAVCLFFFVSVDNATLLMIIDISLWIISGFVAFFVSCVYIMPISQRLQLASNLLSRNQEKTSGEVREISNQPITTSYGVKCYVVKVATNSGNKELLFTADDCLTEELQGKTLTFIFADNYVVCYGEDDE